MQDSRRLFLRRLAARLRVMALGRHRTPNQGTARLSEGLPKRKFAADSKEIKQLYSQPVLPNNCRVLDWSQIINAYRRLKRDRSEGIYLFMER